jgi:hypothetical protein
MQRFPITLERLDDLRLRKLSGDTSYRISQEIWEIETLIAPYRRDPQRGWTRQRVANYAFGILLITLVILMVYYQ